MEVRNGSIWGRVEWTESGASMMADKAYGFLSPVFLHPAKPPFTVTKLTSVALTNNPNLTQLKSLHSQQETEMLEQFRKLFGLPDTADEATVLAAVTSMHSANQAHVALMARIAETAGVAANSAGDAIVTALQSAINKPAPTGDAAKITELEGQVTALHNQLSSYVKVTSEDRAKAVIEQAIIAGKIVPALRDHYVARHVRDAAEVEKEISLLPSLHAGGLGGRQPPKTVEGAELSAEDVSIMALMGVDEKAFTETHKSLHGKAA
jgi:phage I-like protein